MHCQKQVSRLVWLVTPRLILTLIPTRMPLSLINLTKATPLSECWYSVSWKKMTPPRQLLMRSSALKRICRYCLRFSSVFSTPTWASRLAMLPVINTAKVLILLHSIHSLVGLQQCANGWSVLLTHRLICSQDALPWRNYTQSCLMELPLLCLSECGELVCHPDSLIVLQPCF